MLGAHAHWCVCAHQRCLVLTHGPVDPPPSPRSKSIELDDVTFHQCVNLSRFASDKTVSFVPPDGEFELMKYRVTDDVILPFKVMPVIREVGRSRIEATVKVRAAGYSAALAATAVIVRLPVPSHTARATITVTGGKAKYKVEGNCLVWKIKRFPGQSEMQMTADIELVRCLRCVCTPCVPRPSGFIWLTRTLLCSRARWRTRRCGCGRPSAWSSRCPCLPAAA
jgi:hypothetical protein